MAEQPELGEEIVPGALEFSPDQLLAEDPYEEPLIAGGVRCHGGYIAGRYVSPRGRVRRPAIANWQRRLHDAREPLVHIPDRYLPPNYPNYEQAKFLLKEGITEPITRSLTIISIIEGFGARIRDVPVPDLSAQVKDDIQGTALAHLTGGLFEAHARDEAGHRDQGGHKQMWEAARDLGLDKPHIPGDVLMRLMSGSGRGRGERLFPELGEKMEALITTMANVLVVETFAENTFNWAQALLGDPDVSAHAADAAHMVACIAADEIPHVDYLTTAMSELRARTLISEDGLKEFQGSEVVDAIFSRQLRGMATRRPQENRERLREEIHQAIDDKALATRIARKFEDLDSGWSFPHTDDEQLELLLETR